LRSFSDGSLACKPVLSFRLVIQHIVADLL